MGKVEGIQAVATRNRWEVGSVSLFFDVTFLFFPLFFRSRLPSFLRRITSTLYLCFSPSSLPRLVPIHV